MTSKLILLVILKERLMMPDHNNKAQEIRSLLCVMTSFERRDRSDGKVSGFVYKYDKFTKTTSNLVMLVNFCSNSLDTTRRAFSSMSRCSASKVFLESPPSAGHYHPVSS